MTKHTRGPADAANNGKVIDPTNSSRGLARGGRVIDTAYRGTEGRSFHVSGGCQDPGGEPTLSQRRDREEAAKGYLPGVKRG